MRSQGRVRERKREVGRECVDAGKEKDIGGKKAREGETREREKESSGKRRRRRRRRRETE